MAGSQITATHSTTCEPKVEKDCNIDARNQIVGDAHNPLTHCAELTTAVVPSPQCHDLGV